MTWVVAASTIYGYGALYSDVQVTFRDGTTRDLLQKAYPVSNFIAAGFAGSVKIGFMLVQSLMDHLALPGEALDKFAWDPIIAAVGWAPIAKAVFQAAEPAEQALASRLLLVGVSPTETSGIGAKVYFTRFASPDFAPKIMGRPIKVCGIGTGAGVTEYKHSIKPLFRLTSGILKAEIGRPGGWGNQLGHSISHTLGQNPRTGISRHLNIIIVERGQFRLGKTDQTIHYPDGTKTEFKMPAVARGYEEFLALASSAGHEGACAVC